MGVVERRGRMESKPVQGAVVDVGPAVGKQARGGQQLQPKAVR